MITTDPQTRDAGVILTPREAAQQAPQFDGAAVSAFVAAQAARLSARFGGAEIYLAAYGSAYGPPVATNSARWALSVNNAEQLYGETLAEAEEKAAAALNPDLKIARLRESRARLDAEIAALEETQTPDGPDHNQCNEILGKPGHYSP